MSTVIQLQSHHRNALLAKAITFAASEEHLVPSPALRRSVREQIVSSALVAADERCAERPSPSTAAFLAAWLQDIERMVNSFGTVRNVPRAPLRKFLEALRVEISTLACHVCGSGACGEALCDGNTAIAEGGACLAEVGALFHYARAVAEDLYCAAGVSSDAIANATPRLSTSLPDTVSGTLAVGTPQVTGRWSPSKYDSERGGMIPAPIVSLQLPVDALTLGDFQASLYVLFHELIVHAYQRLGAAVRVTDREDPFAEGWMDLIARRIYMFATAGALESLGSPGRAALQPVRRRWIANCAPGLAVASSRATVSGNTGYIDQGIDAAERVLWALSGCGSGSVAGESAFFRLSFRLNSADLASTVRSGLVRKLTLNLPADGREARREHQTALEAISAFTRHEDPLTFAKAVSNL